MKKVLFVASIMGHFKAFHMPYIEYFKEKGYQVEAAAKPKEGLTICEVQHNIDFERQPLKLKNIPAYKKLRKIIRSGNYEIIHCHTPVAAMMTRLAARKLRKKGTRVIYTAHGFHFFKGAPFKNWLIYFPVEWLCSFLTDDLITINREDFAFAKKHLHAKRTHYVPGVGVNIDKFKNTTVDRDKKRAELRIPKDSIAVLSVGELNENKNHETVLRAIASLDRKDIVYVICGKGGKKEYLETLAKELGMEDRLVLAGFRTDVHEIYKCCDMFAFPSKREGLPVSVMEAMASGLPCVVSDIRGNNDLIKDGENGFLCSPITADEFRKNIGVLIDTPGVCTTIEKNNIKDVKLFGIDNVKKEMYEIYNL
ncbi:MAG: glycosyltransferase family 4 protein [Clostridia bacterium]|nr:glycosyltransferase family 4 protein [Clostridia bacterium]